jgi:hypothetical protein
MPGLRRQATIQSAGGVPLGPPAGAARSRLQAAARVTWQAHATRRPCTCIGTEGVKGQTGRPLGPRLAVRASVELGTVSEPQ